jgi:TonB-dependent receptor
MIPNVGATQTIEEKTLSPYMNLATQLRLGGMPLDVNLGLRYERTELTSEGLGQLPTSLTVQASDHTAFLVTYTPTTTIKNSNTYRYLVPNIDLGLWVMDDLKVRLDASRTLTRPPLNYITPVLNVPQGQRVGSLVATGGNPGLLPFTSDNLDLGAEWYYASNSYVSVDFFLKNVTNFIVGGTTQQTINDVIDPTTGKVAVFSVTSRINGPSAEVRGVELAIQHMLGNSGFGFQANATFVSSDKKYDPYNLSVSEFAVTGLANSANLVAFYDKHGFQARLALNWRDEYLDHFGQQQNNSAFGAEPTFVNSSTQLDFSTSYDFLTHYGVYFEALNLNNETYSTHGRFKEQVLDVIDYGRRYTLGVRAKF